MKKYNGIIIYKGASLLDGAPIVVIATGLKNKSANTKTGAMVQTYILRADITPVQAVKTGADKSVCGNCPHTGTLGVGRTCYVNVGQGAQSVYKAYMRGAYPIADSGDITDTGLNRIVRLGTYGDPAAVPVSVWNTLILGATAYTGYTHQWRNAPALKTLCMASADNETDALTARAQGWRTFRVAMPCDAPKMKLESVCPASAEAGKKLTCATCRACDGTGTNRRGSIVIQAHGGFAVMANVRKRSSISIAA